MIVRVKLNCDYGKPGDLVELPPDEAINLIRSGRAVCTCAAHGGGEEAARVEMNRNAAVTTNIKKRGVGGA